MDEDVAERASVLMDMRRETPKHERESAFDGREFARLLMLIKDSDDTMVEGTGYVAGEMTIAAACSDITRYIREFGNEAVDQLNDSHITVITELLKSILGAQEACLLLGLITYSTSRFSRLIQCDWLWPFLAENMKHFPVDLLQGYFTLIANLLTDTKDGNDLESSGLLETVGSVPRQLWNEEYLRMVTAMVRSEGLRREQIENILGVYIEILASEDAPAALKLRSLIDLLALIRKPALEEIVCAQSLRLLPHVQSLSKCRDLKIVVRVLRLCGECLNRSEAFCDCVLQFNFLEWLIEVLDIESIELRRACLVTLGYYIEKAPGFGENDALQVARVDWKSMYYDGSFDIKVAIVRTFRNLIQELPPDAVISVLNEELLRDFCELVQADDNQAKHETYHFLCQLCISPAMQKPNFKSMFLDVVNDVVMDFLQNDELHNEQIRNIAHQTLLTIAGLK